MKAENSENRDCPQRDSARLIKKKMRHFKDLLNFRGVISLVQTVKHF